MNQNAAHHSSTDFNPTPILKVLRTIARETDPAERGDVLVFLPGSAEIKATVEAIHAVNEEMTSSEGGYTSVPLKAKIEDAKPPTVTRFLPLPLHSGLAPEQQDLVFAPITSDSGTARKVICATNIAETSVTIDGIRFVIDTGRHKEADEEVSLFGELKRLKEKWISKAQARQRAGRAGRTGPGICYRLYTEGRFEREFEEFSLPELKRVSLEPVLIAVLALGFEVCKVRFPEALGGERMATALEKLKLLGAIREENVLKQDLGERIPTSLFAPIDLASSGHGYTATTQQLYDVSLPINSPQECFPQTQHPSVAHNHRFIQERLPPLLLRLGFNESRAIETRVSISNPLGRVLARMPLAAHVGKLVLLGKVLNLENIMFVLAAGISGSGGGGSGRLNFDQDYPIDEALVAGEFGDFVTLWNVYREWLGQRITTTSNNNNYSTTNRAGNAANARKWCRENNVDQAKLFDTNRQCAQLAHHLREARPFGVTVTTTVNSDIDATALLHRKEALKEELKQLKQLSRSGISSSTGVTASMGRFNLQMALSSSSSTDLNTVNDDLNYDRDEGNDSGGEENFSVGEDGELIGTRRGKRGGKGRPGGKSNKRRGAAKLAYMTQDSSDTNIGNPGISDHKRDLEFELNYATHAHTLAVTDTVATVGELQVKACHYLACVALYPNVALVAAAQAGAAAASNQEEEGGPDSTNIGVRETDNHNGSNTNSATGPGPFRSFNTLSSLGLATTSDLVFRTKVMDVCFLHPGSVLFGEFGKQLAGFSTKNDLKITSKSENKLKGGGAVTNFKGKGDKFSFSSDDAFVEVDGEFIVKGKNKSGKKLNNKGGGKFNKDYIEGNFTKDSYGSTVGPLTSSDKKPSKSLSKFNPSIDCLLYSGLLQTRRPYLTQCAVAPLLPLILLAALRVDVAPCKTKVVADGWLLVEMNLSSKTSPDPFAHLPFLNLLQEAEALRHQLFEQGLTETLEDLESVTSLTNNNSNFQNLISQLGVAGEVQALEADLRTQKRENLTIRLVEFFEEGRKVSLASTSALRWCVLSNRDWNRWRQAQNVAVDVTANNGIRWASFETSDLTTATNLLNTKFNTESDLNHNASSNSEPIMIHDRAVNADLRMMDLSRPAPVKATTATSTSEPFVCEICGETIPKADRKAILMHKRKHGL